MTLSDQTLDALLKRLHLANLGHQIIRPEFPESEWPDFGNPQCQRLLGEEPGDDRQP
jgi:hypothetical protein